MMNDSSYRLDNYRIMVYDDVLVRWEHHAPLGMARSGRCYFFGDVLIIGQKSRDEDGFFIGEFLDHLKKMPPWTRTRYYCFAGELLDTATGQGLFDETQERFSSFADRSRCIRTQAETAKPGTYRLNHYLITIDADHAISWQAYGALNRIASGQCSIESGVLIIGPEEHDEQGTGKQEFLDALNRLLQWDQTMAWCRGSILRSCQEARQNDERGTFAWCREFLNDRLTDGDVHRKSNEALDPKPQPLHAAAYTIRYREAAERMRQSGSAAMNHICEHLRAEKAWCRWLALSIAVLVVLGLSAGHAIIEKGFPWSHGHKKHHHAHHDHDR